VPSASSPETYELMPETAVDRQHGGMDNVIEFVPRFFLTDRQRELMRIHAWVCADSAFDDIEERGDDPVDPTEWWNLFDRLPECTHRESALWRRQMARSFDDLAEDLDVGDLPRPRTMAEQLALLIVIAQASAAFADAEYSHEVAALASHPRDSDWDAVSDGLMDDRDAEVFYHPATAAQGLQVFPCDTWFTARNGHDPRDARRGYRR
jgi:hypothetical protein